MELHSLLKRQLKRHFGEKTVVPEEWHEFITAVNDAYGEFDIDREMLERSLEISSQELFQANSQMRALFQAIPDLLFRLDDQGTILDFKTGATGDLLLQRQEFFGKRIQDVPDQNIGNRFHEAIRQVLEKKTLISLDYSLTVQGREYSYEARLVPLLENQIVAIIRNITERKRSEETLLKLSRVVEQTADSVLITNSRGVIEYVNPSFEALAGYSRQDLVGQTPRILKSGQHDAEFYAHMWNTILSGRVYNGVLVNRKKSGELYHAEKTITPIKDGAGNITHFVSTEKDITERKHLEAQLRQSQKMEAFGQLAAGVAHDFNNILTVILGNASLLQTQEIAAERKVSAVVEICRASERAANLTRQLLTFSRRQPMQTKDLDLNEVVTNMTKMLQRLIGEHIALEAHYAPVDAPVHADPSMMEQVVMNLAVNSRDSMPKGGRLILQTASVVIDETRPASNPKARLGEFIRLSVGDTGTGIAPEHLPHIFEPFFTTKGIGKGTGLGLATVFGVVEQHRGWIEIESEMNVGTTFHVYIPRLVRKPDAQIETPAPKMIRGGNETVLLVEDEPAVRQMMQHLMERFGYQVHAASSGLRALEIWRERRDSIDVLVTDMVMPEGVSGRELADRLRADKPRLQVIYCSGYTDDMLGQDSPLRNNENFLEKPFEPSKLLQRLRACTDAL